VYQDTIVSDRTIDSHILHIRKKFAALGGKEIIQTQHGVGYKIGGSTEGQ
jgi:two-component system OmpR family response regulator